MINEEVEESGKERTNQKGESRLHSHREGGRETLPGMWEHLLGGEDQPVLWPCLSEQGELRTPCGGVPADAPGTLPSAEGVGCQGVGIYGRPGSRTDQGAD